ncbi:MAG: hypothetical protein HOP29_18995 [Phycisphaerales bacterium]|nr:hypothetical protein [Phycisphaerales bacterium]
MTAFLVVTGHVVIKTTRGTSSWSLFDAAMLGLILSWPLISLFRQWRHDYRHEFIIIGLKGVSWRVSGFPEFSVEWSEIEGFSASPFFEAILLRPRGSRLPITIPRCVRPESMKFSELALLIQQHWQQARASLASEGASRRNRRQDDAGSLSA